MKPSLIIGLIFVIAAGAILLIFKSRRSGSSSVPAVGGDTVSRVKDKLLGTGAEPGIKLHRKGDVKPGDEPIFRITTSVISSSGNYTVAEDIYYGELPLSISSKTGEIWDKGSTMAITVPNLNVGAPHTVIYVDESRRLICEHLAPDNSTKIFFSDSDGDFDADNMVPLKAAKQKGDRISARHVITKPEFMLQTGFAESVIELLPGITNHVEDRFAVLEIREKSLAPDFHGADDIKDPADGQVLIPEDFQTVRIYLRNGYKVGRYTDADIHFHRDCIEASRAGFSVVIGKDGSYIHSYSRTHVFTNPDGTPCKPIEKTSNYPLVQGLTFTDGAYDYVITEYFTGYTFDTDSGFFGSGSDYDGYDESDTPDLAADAYGEPVFDTPPYTDYGYGQGDTDAPDFTDDAFADAEVPADAEIDKNADTADYGPESFDTDDD